MATKRERQQRVLRLAERYGKAVEHWCKIYDEVETVRGLDEFDPKHCAWETRLFYADKKKQWLKDRLLRASYELAIGKRFQF